MVDALNFTDEAAYYEAVREEEEELFGDGYRNESQRVLAHSRATAEYPRQQAKIDALVAQGRFVIANHYPVFCPSTDAIIGEAICYVSDFATREEAEAVFTSLNIESDPEFYYALYPVERQAEPEAPFNPNAASDTDEVLF